MNKIARSLSGIFLFLFLCSTAYAQQTVEGTVTSADDGEPLPGVNITVEGTTIGTTSDTEGNYSIEVPEENNVLVFSFVGYQTQEVEINGRSQVDVVLQTQVYSSGDELLVVGYGTQREADLTGSIKRVGSDEITKQPSLTAMESLQGKVSGVNIINSDAPGSSPSVILRGLGTALGGRDPLYVVDGVPVDDINNISPSDIESIDVMKDASSASIYGLRAANGVIIVSTKEGNQGAPQFEVESYSGYNSVLNQVQMANAQQYINYFNEESSAVGGFELSSSQEQNTDWYDELINMGYEVNNSVSVSGGLENINYFLSYNMMQEKGLLEEQKFLRQTIRNNNQFRLFDDILTIDQNLSLSFTDEIPQPLGVFNTAYRQSPLVPTYYSNGKYGQAFVNQETGVVTYEGDEGAIGRLNSHGNPLTTIAFNNQESNTITLQGSASADLNLTDYLTFTSRFGATKFYSDRESYNPAKQRWLAGDPTRTPLEYETRKAENPEATTWADNSLVVSNTESFRWNWDNFLAFAQNFGAHDVELTLGMSSEKFGIGTRFRGNAYDVPEEEQYWNLNLASDNYEKEVNHTNFTPSTLLSYFGRVQYNFDERYYLTGTLRRDGSSKFSNNKEFWELFPSVGLGWTLSNEEFMSDNEAIDFLKLRASWGRLGNQNVPFNSTNIYSSTGSASQNYVFGPNQTLRFGASAGSPARDISWEIVSEWNFGLDLETLDNRLSTTVDFYQKTTENVILLVSPLPNSPFSEDFYDHGGKVVNKGIELSLDWSDEVSQDFSYNLGASFSYNTNEVTNVVPGYEGLTGGSLNNGEITKRLAEGQPLGAWWLYEVEGVWQSEEQIDENPSMGGAMPGYLRYKDLNDDGVIDERDRRYFGSYVPKYNVGINVGANYKSFDFSMDAFGVAGNKVYNGLKNTRLGGENITKDMYDNRWTGEGSTNAHPGANRDELPSDYYLEDGSYLRINNITLGYTFSDIAQYVSGVRLYMSAQNPFLVTGYSGFTPELIGNNNGDPYGTSGIEFSAYPNTRTLLFGVNIDLQ